MTQFITTYISVIALLLLTILPGSAELLTYPVEKEPIKEELKAYAINKIIPDELEEVILTALSRYPELLDTRIEFRFKNNIKKSVMQAQPRVATIFHKKASRKYVIKISRYLKLKHDQVDITELPFKVLVGWIGHELGHIMDYKDRGALGMLSFVARYVFSDSYVIGAEKRADMYALKHGLGTHIMATKQFVLNHEDMPDDYLKKVQRLYMSPDDFQLLTEEGSNSAK